MKTCCTTIFFLCISLSAFAQGRNHNFLIGYTSGIDTNVVSKRGWLQFDTNTVTVTPDNFKMPFRAAQGNISDEQGNLLMVSNGCWIADATLDTMQNGGGLNPNSYTSSWCNSTTGLPYHHSDIFLPFPGDSTKYILFHQTGTSSSNFKSSHVYYSVIDINLNAGKGGVIPGQKNVSALQAGINPGMAACRHANGRDWWIIAFKDSSDIVYKFLLSPSGVSAPVQQSLGVTPYPVYLLGQMNFSPDGKKMAYSYYDGVAGALNYSIRLFNFDRCSGMFSNATILSFTETQPGLGLSFSANSKNLYVSTVRKIIQFNVDTNNVQASLDTVAVYDGYCFPFNFLCTDFWVMYLAANGKIYVSSGNSVIDLHYINYPDSSGLACDVQQHALPLPCYSGRGHVYHPNYYLGCDTTCGPCFVVGVNETGKHDFKFSLSPNPTNGSIKIIYLLPQNKSGMFELYDVTGKKVFTYTLPPWSTLQHFDLSFLSNGMYHAVITSDGFTKAEKLVLLRP